MDRQQQQNVNRAAQEWTEAFKTSFKVLANQTVNLQESNRRLMQSFFQQFVEQLRSNSEWQQRGEEPQRAFETLAEESANTYSDYLNSALSFYQQTMSQATQVAQSNLQTAEQVAQSGVQAAGQAAQQATQAATQAAQHAVLVPARPSRRAIRVVADVGDERPVPIGGPVVQADHEPAASKHTTPDRAAAMRLIDDLLSEDPSYDKETWPEIAEALDRDGPSRRKLFVD